MNRLKELRSKEKLSQQFVAMNLGITQQAYANYEAGKRQPDNETLLKLSDFFDVSVDYLLGRSDIKKERRKGVLIPVLGRVQAGIPMEAIEDIIGYEEIDEALSRRGEYFALQIRGNSMEPKFSEGDVVIVRKQEDADSGDIVIAIINGDDATIKRLKKLPNGIMLIPSNPAFEPIIYTRHDIIELPVRILGKVVELRAKF